MRQIILLAASRGAGKTTACLRFVELAQARGLRVGGIAAPGVAEPEVRDESGRPLKVTIDVLDLATGERRRLAEATGNPDQATVGRYRFHDDALAWSLRVALDALARPLDVVVIDEVGRLELRGGGYAPVLEALGHAAAEHVIVGVRDAYADQVAARLEGLPVHMMLLTAENRTRLPQNLLDAVKKPSGT